MLACALGCLLAFFTQYIDDDAFITFRYARQIARGGGFVYNLGDPVYGTTSPLFALLLAGPSSIRGVNLPVAAQVIDILATSVGLVLLWLFLQRAQATPAQQLAVIVLVGMSSRLWYMNSQGMETPLVLLLMLSSWYALASERPLVGGVLAGILLWARIDSAAWVLCSSLAVLRWHPRSAPRYLLVSVGTYLPWVLFATLYFGSPIPQTVTAKWVAYVASGGKSILSGLGTIARYMSPVDLSASTERVAPILAALTIGLAFLGALRAIRSRWFLVFPLFVVGDSILLATTRATFFNRYFVPVLWTTLVLAGLSLGAIAQRLAASSHRVRALAQFLFVSLATTIALITPAAAAETRNAQVYRNEASLKAIGLWLNAHTPEGASVLVEPLGYIGYYSNRQMLDEVGLVTPAVVDLKRHRVSADLYAQRLGPDYVVVHCDDIPEKTALSGQQDNETQPRYAPVATFDPLGFKAGQSTHSPHSGMPRGSCYEIWRRVPR